MDILFLAETLDVIGKVLLGITVLSVHWHVVKEHKIDGDVFRAMKRERIYGFLGIAFIVLAYLIKILA